MSSQTLTLHNLPPQSTRFVGRKATVADIVARLCDADCHLLTLVGTGGIGKTRLAIEVMQNLADGDFRHGAYYVPLAPLTSADGIATSIISALGMMVGNNQSLHNTLFDFLAERETLLVLDNFEHVMDGTDLVAEILVHAPDMTILVTSREILNLSMEHIWRVRGLPYPSDSEPEDINQYDALNLFIERALQVRQDFTGGDEQVNIIRICQLVDGLPLGIELAAGWLKSLSTGEIIKQIERGIDILSTRARDVKARHRSIRAVFDHSWQLLSADEQAVFPRLSVFRGGFTLEAAEQVAGASLMTLSGLIDKSMIRQTENGRYDLHELLRQYGHKLLIQSDELEAAQQGHMRYFAELTETYAEWLKDDRQADAYPILNADNANLYVAWQTAVNFADFDMIAKMTEALNMHSTFEGFHLINLPVLIQKTVQALPKPDTPAQHRCINRLQAWQAHYVELRNFYNHLYAYENASFYQTTIEQYQACLRIARETDDDLTSVLFYVAIGMKLDTTDSLPDELKIALDISQQYGDLWYVCLVLRSIIRHYFYRHRVETDPGDRYMQMYVDVAVTSNDPTNIAEAYGILAIPQFDRGQVREAIQSNQIAVDHWRRIGNIRAHSFSEIKQGSFYVSVGDWVQARKHLLIGIQLRIDNQLSQHYGSMLLAKLEAIEGNPEQGLRLLHDIKYEERGGVYQYEVASLCYIELGDMTSAKREMTRVLEVGLTAVGNRPMLDLLPHVAWLLYHEQSYTLAVEILGLVESHPSSAIEWMEQWQTMNQVRHDLHDKLGDDTYQQAWERGSQRDLAQAVDELFALLSGETTDEQPLIEPLTDRELDVLQLLSTGKTNKQIAGELIVAVGTVKAHVYNICQKLGVKNRLQAVNEARRLHLL